MTSALYLETIKILESKIRSLRYKGHDPYDALNQSPRHGLESKYLNIIKTQLLVYSPINFRNIFGINKELNPKAVGLLISSYCKLEKLQFYPPGFCLEIAEILARWLIRNRSKSYKNYCWGYNFPWQTSQRYLDRNVPTIVNSSFIGNSFIDLFNLTKKNEYLKVADSICRFIIKDIQISDFNEGICFSYTPLDTHVVHNANVLGASFLARVHSKNANGDYLTYAKKAFNFTISGQKENGMWPYSLDINSGVERNQIDWHQGFILDSINDFINNTKPESNIFQEGLILGANFYFEEQFSDKGVAYWRWPRKWPIDIHNQAQGIITFSKLSHLDVQYKKFSKVILDWTLNEMKDDKGLFYYQKWPYMINKNNYMRWSQCWMFLALTTFISNFHDP